MKWYRVSFNLGVGESVPEQEVIDFVEKLVSSEYMKPAFKEAALSHIKVIHPQIEEIKNEAKGHFKL